MNCKIDVIGDVHGQHDKLVEVLRLLGYRHGPGGYSHPDGRLVVFVGDIIDRGPSQLATVQLVRRMVESGNAVCLMGNHELSAIEWVTPSPDDQRKFVRERVDFNRRHHEAFLQEVGEDSRLHLEIIDWFRTLPLVFTRGALRVSHALWDENSVAFLSPWLTDSLALSPAGLQEAMTQGSLVRHHLELVLKGVEADVPSYLDPFGKPRSSVRLAWWRKTKALHAMMLPFGEMGPVTFADRELTDAELPRLSPEHLHLFGHYWMRGPLALVDERTCCVDFSGMSHRPVTAYSWDGESVLSPQKLTQSS